MATVKPLVVEANGQVRQIADGDTIPSTAIPSGATVTTTQTVPLFSRIRNGNQSIPVGTGFTLANLSSDFGTDAGSPLTWDAATLRGVNNTGIVQRLRIVAYAQWTATASGSGAQQSSILVYGTNQTPVNSPTVDLQFSEEATASAVSAPGAYAVIINVDPGEAVALGHKHGSILAAQTVSRAILQAEACTVATVKGDNGNNGWSPALAVESDGERRVHRVVGWTGGTGTAPSAGHYVGPNGAVATPAEATDIRGAAGADSFSSLDGVSNSGGNIDLVPAGPLAIAGDDAANTITFTVDAFSKAETDSRYAPKGAQLYKGLWDASTGNPPSATPDEGDFYIVSVAGNTNLNGETDWQPKDWAAYVGGAWRKVDNSEATQNAAQVPFSPASPAAWSAETDNVAEALDDLRSDGDTHAADNNRHLTPAEKSAITALSALTTAGLLRRNADGSYSASPTITAAEHGKPTGPNLHDADSIDMPAMDDLPAENLAVRDSKYLHEGTTAQEKAGDLGAFTLKSRARSDSATISTTELVTNGDFSGGATGWTAGAGWVINTTNATLTVANGTGELSTAATIAVVSGRSYRIAWAQTNSTTGSVFLTPRLGTVSGVPIGATSAQVQVIRANTTGTVSLAFAVSNAASGTVSVDNVSALEITDWAAQREARNAAGSVVSEHRASASNLSDGASGLRSNTTGGSNTNSGTDGLSSNTTGTSNTNSGANGLRNNTTGSNNSNSGRNGLSSNTTGSSNTNSGADGLFNNTTGSNNANSGVSGLANNTTGNSNTNSGANGLLSNTTGIQSTNSGANGLREMGGNILTLTVDSGGSGYTTAIATVSGGGSTRSATFAAVISGGSIVSWTRTRAGAGFGATTAPTVVTISGDGTGATATAGAPVNSAGSVFAFGYRDSEQNDVRIDTNCGFIGNSTGRDSAAAGIDTPMTNAYAIGNNALVGGSNTMALGGTAANAVKVVVGATNSTAEVGSVVATGAVVMGTKTVAQLAALTGIPTAALYWASNGRAYVNTAGAMNLQGAGAGTGVLAQYNGTTFVIPGTTTAIAA